MSEAEPLLNLIDFVHLAEQEGLEAFVGGDELGDNPFNPSNELHEAWARGWRDGAKHHE